MAKFELVFKRSVAKDLRAVPRKDVARILACIRGSDDDPRPVGATKLSTHERYRIRQGVYRILYEVEADRLVVTVVKIGHRRDVYRKS